MQPSNPVLAACHDDPYPYYQQLQRGPALAYQPDLQLWVASRSDVIDAVFGHADCVVRPPAEAVPAQLAGGSAGTVFGHLVRMNEGAAHTQPALVLRQALAGLDLAGAAASAAAFSATLAGGYAVPAPGRLTPWMVDLPTYVVANLLGFERDELPRVALWMADFVRCLSPLSSTAQIDAAHAAAGTLLQRFTALVAQAGLREKSLLLAVRRRAALAGWDDQQAVLANLIGLLSQTHEATAGLIGNCLVALLRRAPLQARLRADPALADAFVREVCRYDAPVQNTRRFVARAATVAGVDLPAGATILLLLGAAGRDPAVYQRADELLPERMLEQPAPRLPGFGTGRHACPGQALALAIAAAAVRHVLALPLPLDPARFGWSYRPSVNARLPEFAAVAGVAP